MISEIQRYVLVLSFCYLLYVFSLGFCTWDAFYSSVDSDKVSAGLDSLRDAGVTVKYVILDDGWQSTALSSKGKDQNKSSNVKDKDKHKKLSKTSTSSTHHEDQMNHENSVVLVGKRADTEEDDGELSGAQIDGNLAAQKMLEKESSFIVQVLTQVSICLFTFYAILLICGVIVFITRIAILIQTL